MTLRRSVTSAVAAGVAAASLAGCAGSTSGTGHIDTPSSTPSSSASGSAAPPSAVSSTSSVPSAPTSTTSASQSVTPLDAVACDTLLPLYFKGATRRPGTLPAAEYKDLPVGGQLSILERGTRVTGAPPVKVRTGSYSQVLSNGRASGYYMCVDGTNAFTVNTSESIMAITLHELPLPAKLARLKDNIKVFKSGYSFGVQSLAIVLAHGLSWSKVQGALGRAASGSVGAFGTILLTWTPTKK